jgi:hypothetical protein
MNPTQVVVLGTLKPDGTVELDEKLVGLPPGRVQLTVQPIAPPSPSGPGLLEVLDRIHREQEARGYQARSKEEIDEEINALRDEWEERMQEIERIQDGARRPGGKPGC